jgi:hypothetical protein
MSEVKEFVARAESSTKKLEKGLASRSVYILTGGQISQLCPFTHRDLLLSTSKLQAQGRHFISIEDNNYLLP